MTRIDHIESLAELLDVEPAGDLPGEDDLRDLRDDIEADLVAITSEWGDRPDSPLRITKARLQSTGICHAQVLSEAEPFVLDTDVAAGAICDIAAGFVVIHPTFEPAGDWFEALRWALAQERPDILELVERLDPDQRAVFLATVNERCNALGDLIGDVRRSQPTIRERARLPFDRAGVLLSTETDILLRQPHPTIVELKNGKLGPWVLDELRFYALVRSLRDLRPPTFLCSISLSDRNITALPLRFDDLTAAARRVVATAEALVDIDRSVSAGQAVATSPGGHCRWCRRARSCPAVSDTVLSELPPVTMDMGATDFGAMDVSAMDVSAMDVSAMDVSAMDEGVFDDGS